MLQCVYTDDIVCGATELGGPVCAEDCTALCTVCFQSREYMISCLSYDYLYLSYDYDTYD